MKERNTRAANDTNTAIGIAPFEGDWPPSGSLRGNGLALGINQHQERPGCAPGMLRMSQFHEIGYLGMVY